MAYETMGEETAGEGYATVGEDSSGVGLVLRRPGMPALPIRKGMSIPLYPRPGAPAPGGLSRAEVEKIVHAAIDARAPYSDIPSKPQQDEAMFPMGLGSATILPATALGTVALTAQPQRAFRGERLVLAIFRSAGAAGIPVVIDSFQIGDYKQLIGGGALPVDVFASDAFGVRLMLDGSVPGILYSLTVRSLVVVPAGESIIVAGAVIGRAGEAAAR